MEAQSNTDADADADADAGSSVSNTAGTRTGSTLEGIGCFTPEVDFAGVSPIADKRGRPFLDVVVDGVVEGGMMTI